MYLHDIHNMSKTEIKQEYVSREVSGHPEEVHTPNTLPNSNAASFETAISATGFGKFNLFLLSVAIPSAMSPVFESSTMSFVLPAAQCDLNLSLNDKGLLNAITFGGMISSGLLWGYLCDTLGRKKLLAVGYILDGIFVLISSLSPSFLVLMITKFFGGFIINGPFAALSCYLAEFHCMKYRSRIQIIRGIIICLANFILPLLAWFILPRKFSYNIFGIVDFHAWNLFLILCALPPLISGICFAFMPESPKFLMSVGRNEEALQIFKTVYSLNSGKPKSTYSIRELVDEIKLHQNDNYSHGGHVTANRTKVKALLEGWQQIKPIFFPPYLPKLLLVCFVQSLLMMVVNTIRLWLPQIFQTMNDFQHSNNVTNYNLCKMLETMTTQNKTEACSVNYDNSSVYINSMIVASVTIAGYLLAGSIINKVGKKAMLLVLYLVASACGTSMYFSETTAMTLILSSIFLSKGSICSNIMQTITIDLFPTTLRSMTISLLMMAGRTGVIIGNLIFPILLSWGCGAVFFSAGIVLVGCALMSLLLPSTEMKALE